ncbi:MAG: hypothetical protein EBS89_07435, partial [Proteobacteria bacterium]|nr:hypothetical protein [Pseudomonadota bacterium]
HMYAGRNWNEAREQAQANADFFKCDFVVFTDTSGNLHVERRTVGPTEIEVEIFKPGLKKRP